MAIDQRDITSQLRMMDDRVLQQYAAMHKNDPYVFPLAFQESQNRQKVRMSGQAQMAGQEMPKVADAALMAMTPQAAPQQAPQGQGISNLPAPNMQRMADGGIAGYEDDEEGMATGGMGGMFNFAQQSEPVVRMAGGGVARYNGATGSVTGVSPELLSKYQREATEMAMGTRMQFSPDVKAVVGKIQAAQEGSYLKEEQKQMLEGSPLRNKKQDAASMVAPTASTASAAYDPTENLKKLAQTNARYTTPSEPKNAEEAAMLNRYPATKPAADKAPPAKAKAKTKVEAPIPNVEAPAPTPDALASLGIVPYGQSKAGDAPAYTPKTAEEIRTKSEALAAPELAKIQASYKPFGEQFAQDRSRIDTREKNMLSDALIRGGLKTMAGRSQFAMQNIGEGGLEALNVYQETQKTNDAARKALTQSEMLMSQAQRAEERGARGEAVSLFAQAEKAEQVGLQFQQKAQEMASTEKFQQGSLLVAQQNATTASRNADANMVAARNRGAGVGAMALSREAQLQLNAAKLELADISKQLEKDIRLNLPKNAEAKARLETRRNQLRADIAKLGGSDTISEIPLAGSGSGDKVLDFAKI
jgi:hypothetical protein